MTMADKISTLPDVILCHVLSFLPTKQAVATSLLSKRWRHLWRTVITLDFSNITVRGESDNLHFNQFVYSVLLSRDADHPIKSFRLQFRDGYPDSAYLGLANVDKWVNFVVQRGGVEFLHLHVFCEDWRWPKLPISILTCRTLVVLKLDSLLVEGVSSVALPSLKTLHFEFIYFSKVLDLMLLLAGCPNLKDLHVTGVGFDDGLKLNVLAELFKHCPKLQRLDLDQSQMDEMYWTGVEGEYIWVDPEFVPQCLSLHLRTCNLLSFSGLEGELLFARYILKNAKVLQTMGIWNKGQTNIKRLLSSCPRASATCKLAVYDDRP